MDLASIVVGPAAVGGSWRVVLEAGTLDEIFLAASAGYGRIRCADATLQKLTALALLMMTSCMSSGQIDSGQFTSGLVIPATASVRAPDLATAQMVASDLVTLQIFESVRIDDQSRSDYDLLAIYQPPKAPSDAWFCGEPGGMAFLSLISLLILPSCVAENVYGLDLMPSGSHELISVESESKMNTWMGLQTLVMNLSPKWQWGAPDENVRREIIQSAFSSRREDILQMLALGSERDGDPD